MLDSKLLLGGLALLFLMQPKKAEAAQTPAPKPRPRPRKPKPAAKPQAKPQAALPKPLEVTVIPKTPPKSPTDIVWPSQAELVPSGPRSKTPYATTPALKREDGSNPQTEAAALAVRERQPFDSSYWMPVKRATAAEVQRANAILATNFAPGGVTFDGPYTMAGRRQYRAVQNGAKRSVVIYQPKPPFR